TPLELAAIRAAIGFIGLVLWVGARRRRLSVRARDLPLFVLYGFISIALFQWAYFATLEHTTVAISVALLYTAPAFVVVISRLFGGEALSRARLAALGMVLAGVFLVTGALRALLSGGASISAAALGYGLLSGLTYGMYTIFGKLAVRDHDPVETVMLAFLFGAIALSALAPPWRPILAHPAHIPAFLLMGLLPTLAAYAIYNRALRHLPAGTASILATAEPVVATLLGVFILGEALALDQVAGIALIVAAAILIARAAGRHQPEGRHRPAAVVE